MTTPAAPPRRLTVLHIILIIAVTVVLTVALVLGLIAAGIIGYAQTGGTSAQDRDRALTATDPAGGRACDRLDNFMALQLGSFTDAQAEAGNALTTAIRNANTPEAMRAACIDSGANMSPR